MINGRDVSDNNQAGPRSNPAKHSKNGAGCMNGVHLCLSSAKGKEKSWWNPKSETRRKQTVPLFKCLFRAFYPELLTSNIIRLLGDSIQFVNPALLG